jgi:hypothetical protein
MQNSCPQRVVNAAKPSRWIQLGSRRLRPIGEASALLDHSQAADKWGSSSAPTRMLPKRSSFNAPLIPSPTASVRPEFDVVGAKLLVAFHSGLCDHRRQQLLSCQALGSYWPERGACLKLPEPQSRAIAPTKGGS